MVRRLADFDDRATRRGSAARQRVPPHNIEAEESLLGRHAAVEGRDRHRGRNGGRRRLLQAGPRPPVRGRSSPSTGRGSRSTPSPVAEALRRAGVLDALGGKNADPAHPGRHPGGVATPPSTPASSPTTPCCAAWWRSARRSPSSATPSPTTSPTVLDRAETLVFDVANRRQTTSLRGIHATLQDSLAHLEALFEHDGQTTGVPTGFRDLDEVLLGWQPSNLIVVAARPGQGKTAFALGTATHAALHERRPVVFFSMEMGYLELTQRILAAEAGVDSRLLRTGRIPESDWSRISTRPSAAWPRRRCSSTTTPT